jgi:hypothetical protein
MAFEIVKAMQADGLDWGEGYRPLGRQALEEIIEDQMAAAPVAFDMVRRCKLNACRWAEDYRPLARKPWPTSAKAR